jgi:ABC-type bacteriocin/lantibiotic exporter with double-glycine peptidase domain
VQRLDDWVPLLLVCMSGMLLLIAGLTWLQQRHLLLLETRLALGTSARFLWHILRLPMEFFAQRFGGEVGARVTINDRVARLLSGELANMALSLLTVLFYLSLMFLYDWILASISLGIALLNFVVLHAVNEVRRDTSRRLQQETGKLMGTTLGGLLSIEPLKSSGGESDFYAKWIGYFGKTVNAEQTLGRADRMLGVVPGLLMSLNTAAVLCIGGLRVMDGAMSMGTVIAFYYLMGNFLIPVGRFVQLGALLQTAEADLNRIDDVLRYAPAPGMENDRETLQTEQPKLAGELELRALTYGYYRLGTPLIENFSLKLAPGARVALVGGSGSGKSTLARIVCGLHEPWSGEILFDGRPRTAWPRSVLNNSLSFVDQDVMVFEDSVRQNLTLWNPALPDAQLLRAARDACIHDDIMARPGGYDGLVRGGQLQRLELARALAQNPSLLVLDEATSALDAYTEMQVMENLRRRGCTCLLVSHRLSAIRDCDEIIVLRYGKVVQRGTHESLMAAGGHYADLLSAA